MHDFVNNCLLVFGVDFKTENQKKNISLYYFRKGRKKRFLSKSKKLYDLYSEEAFKPVVLNLF